MDFWDFAYSRLLGLIDGLAEVNSEICRAQLGSGRWAIVVMEIWINEP